MNFNAFLILATLIRIKKTTYTELISEFSEDPFPLQAHQIAYGLSLLEKEHLIEKTPLNTIPYSVEIRSSTQGIQIFQKVLFKAENQPEVQVLDNRNYDETRKMDDDDIMELQEEIQEILSDHLPTADGVQTTVNSLTRLFFKHIP